jgi:hypothetical protein
VNLVISIAGSDVEDMGEGDGGALFITSGGARYLNNISR